MTCDGQETGDTAANSPPGHRNRVRLSGVLVSDVQTALLMPTSSHSLSITDRRGLALLGSSSSGAPKEVVQAINEYVDDWQTQQHGLMAILRTQKTRMQLQQPAHWASSGVIRSSGSSNGSGYARPGKRMICTRSRRQTDQWSFTRRSSSKGVWRIRKWTARWRSHSTCRQLASFHHAGPRNTLT